MSDRFCRHLGLSWNRSFSTDRKVPDMATPEEQAENEKLLAWLKAPSEQQQAEYDDLTEMRRHLGVGLPSREAARRDFEAFARALLPPTRKASRDDWRHAERNVTGWYSIGYEPDDVRPWLRAGVDPSEYDVVAELVAEGITPERATVQFQHPRTGEQVTVLDVARRFLEDFSSISDALDDAGVERVKQPRPSYLFRRPGA